MSALGAAKADGFLEGKVSAWVIVWVIFSFFFVFGGSSGDLFEAFSRFFLLMFCVFVCFLGVHRAFCPQAC